MSLIDNFETFKKHLESNKLLIVNLPDLFEWIQSLGYKEFVENSFEIGFCYNFFKIEDNYISYLTFEKENDFFKITKKTKLIKNDQIISLLLENFDSLAVNNLQHHMPTFSDPTEIEYKQLHQIIKCGQKNQILKRVTKTYTGEYIRYTKGADNDFYVSLIVFKENIVVYIEFIIDNHVIDGFQFMDIISLGLPTIDNFEDFENLIKPEEQVIIRALLI